MSHPFADEVRAKREASEARDIEEAAAAGELLSDLAAKRLKEEAQLKEMLELGTKRSPGPAQSTIDAYNYVRVHAPERLAAWLESHCDDAPFLLKDSK